MRNRELIHTTLFFIRTTLFSVHVNPLLLLLIPFAILFAITGDLDKTGVFFCMLLFTITGLTLKKIQLHSSSRTSSNTVSTLFRLLPIETQTTYSSFLLSSFIYSLILNVLFAFLLKSSLSLPDLDALTVAFNPETAISTVSGTYYSARGFLMTHSQYAYPSLIFGTLTSTEGWPSIPGALVILPLFGTAVTTTFLCRKQVVGFKSGKGITAFATVLMLILLLFVAGDLFLPSHTIAELRQQMTVLHFPSLFSTLIVACTLLLPIEMFQSVRLFIRSNTHA